jgi:hypothetical protein
MISILIQQPLNFWRRLEKLYKTEAILLFILMFAFIATRANTQFESWLLEGGSPAGIALLVSNLFSLQINLSSLAVISWLLPRQQGLSILLTHPLDHRLTLQALGYYTFKYLFVYILLFLPIAITLLNVFDFWFSLLSILIVIVSSLFFFLIQVLIKEKFPANYHFLLLGLIPPAFYYVFFALFYWVWGNVLLFQIAIIIVFFMLSILIYKGSLLKITLTKFISFSTSNFTRQGPLFNSTKFNIPTVFPDKIQSLFEKELFSVWRNIKYRRLKFITFLSFALLCLFTIIYSPEFKEVWIVVLSLIFIWVHYSTNFNEKYTLPEPSWFVRTTPIHFHHILISKYLSEIMFVLLMVLTAFIFLILTELSLKSVLIIITVIMAAAHIILFSMLNVKIMFFDNARLAGYAYHFSIIFFGIMIFNYRLAGPVITLIVLIYFLYKNVKYFNN